MLKQNFYRNAFRVIRNTMLASAKWPIRKAQLGLILAELLKMGLDGAWQ